ncbi:hypothetical protein [Mycobacterium sp.]|uniref:hypothetical protein n=1 Tax=Mycobacterium sp. TaxID=1785 RepID=UPI0025CC615D|nr:hypothetical protein [Mycobacterium sp.]
MTISGRAKSLVSPPAITTGGRAGNDGGRLRAVIASQAIRDQIAAQLWARGYPNVCVSRSNIEGRAMAPEPRRQS